MLTDDCFRIESLQFNTSNIAATFGSLCLPEYIDRSEVTCQLPKPR
jgi:hypothetical protein